jgi:hypothetical protein
VRALRASAVAHLDAALARSLAVGPADIGRLAARLGLDLDRRGPAVLPRFDPPRRASGPGPEKRRAPGRAGTSKAMNQPPRPARSPAASGRHGRDQGGTGARAGGPRRPAPFGSVREATAPGRGTAKPARPRPGRTAGRRPTRKRS